MSSMGELRLYAISLDEVRGMFGAHPQEQERLRRVASTALTPPRDPARHGGLIGKLGPILRRPPGAVVISPTQPVPQDVDVLLSGGYVPPDRTGATWRLLEILVQGTAWSSTLMSLSPESLDELDFALARGGVHAAVGLRHLLTSPTSISLVPVHGLTVGWHPYEKALAMAEAYRAALPEIKTQQQQEMVAALVGWLDGFTSWSQVAAEQGRPVPDLVGFWAN